MQRKKKHVTQEKEHAYTSKIKNTTQPKKKKIVLCAKCISKKKIIGNLGTFMRRKNRGKNK